MFGSINALKCSAKRLTVLFVVATANDRHLLTGSCHRERVIQAHSGPEIRPHSFELDEIQSHLTNSGHVPFLEDLDAARSARTYQIRTAEVRVVRGDPVAAAFLHWNPS